VRAPISQRECVDYFFAWVPNPNGAFSATLGWDSTAVEFEGIETPPSD
jgi:hypothetical protein